MYVGETAGRMKYFPSPYVSSTIEYERVNMSIDDDEHIVVSFALILPADYPVCDNCDSDKDSILSP